MNDKVGTPKNPRCKHCGSYEHHSNWHVDPNSQEPPDKPQCELCGSDVKVVGTTTLHYEPDKPELRTWWIKADYFSKGILHPNDDVFATPIDIKVIEASYAKALELQVEELKKELSDTRQTYYEVVEQRNGFYSRVRELELELAAAQKDADFWHSTCAKLSNKMDKK